MDRARFEGADDLMIRFLSFLALFAVSSACLAESYGAITLRRAVEPAEHIAVVRIVKAELTQWKRPECKYLVHVETLDRIRGEALTSFHTDSTPFVGSRYFVMGKKTTTCEGGEHALELPGVGSIKLIAPWDYDMDDDESWVLMVRDDVIVPKEVRVLGDMDFSCLVARSVVACIAPPPFFNLKDMVDVLRKQEYAREAR